MPPKPSSPTSVFLSHTHKDKPFVRRLAGDLQQHGIYVWVDEAELLVGDSIIEKVQEAIGQVDYVAVVLSKHSIKSEWVKREVDTALHDEIKGKKVKVLPLKYGDCVLPGFLNGKLYLDFTDEQFYNQNLSRLLERLLPSSKRRFYTPKPVPVTDRREEFHPDTTGSGVANERAKIASYIAKHVVRPRDQIFIGPGITCFAVGESVARSCHDTRITTNNVMLPYRYAELYARDEIARDVRLEVVKGSVDLFSGTISAQRLDNFRSRLLIISPTALSAATGITVNSFHDDFALLLRGHDNVILAMPPQRLGTVAATVVKHPGWIKREIASGRKNYVMITAPLPKQNKAEYAERFYSELTGLAELGIRVHVAS